MCAAPATPCAGPATWPPPVLSTHEFVCACVCVCMHIPGRCRRSGHSSWASGGTRPSLEHWCRSKAGERERSCTALHLVIYHFIQRNCEAEKERSKQPKL